MQKTKRLLLRREQPPGGTGKCFSSSFFLPSARTVPLYALEIEPATLSRISAARRTESSLEKSRVVMMKFMTTTAVGR